MSKRYKEFLIDILTKSYQIIFGVAVISPLITKNSDWKIILIGSGFALLLAFWAGAISVRLED